MKRIISITCLAAILLSLAVPMFALAAESADTSVVSERQPSNVTITVVMPDVAGEPKPTEPASTQVLMFPSDVTEMVDNGVRRIIKTYELTADEKPEDIPRDSFERGGYKYMLTDIIRRETANAETRDHLEVVTINTETKELEQILPMLASTIEFTDEDGFVGILALDITTLKVETAGTQTSSYTASVTREYPRLSTNDTSLVPKTVEDRGKTYTLAGVDWRIGNYETVDYEQIAEYYTAVATYTTTGTTTTVTGYTTTVEYSGTLAKLTQGKTLYTAYFEGEAIRIPLELAELTTSEATEPNAEDAVDAAKVSATPEDSHEDAKPSRNYAWFFIVPIVGVAVVAYYFIRKARGKDTGAE